MMNKHKKSRQANENSDSDGAPEEVTFKEGLEKMLETKRNISKKVEEEKERLKQKRKRQEEMFIEQKKQKLARLESMKLPDDVLEGIEEGNNDKSEKSKIVKMVTEDDVSDVDMEDDNDDENLDDFEGEQEDEEVNKDIPERNNRIIPIHDVPTSKINSAFEKARDFKNKALFGQAAKRQSIKSYLSVRDKRKFVR